MRLTYIIIYLFFVFSNCYDENRVDSVVVNQRIQALIEAKTTQCGDRPPYPLFFTRDASPKEVETCETDMLNRACPFKTYPWSCVRIF